MAFFGKRKSGVEEILDKINALSEEDQAKLLGILNPPKEENESASDDGEKVADKAETEENPTEEKVEEKTEEKTEVVEEKATEESVTQPENDGKENELANLGEMLKTLTARLDSMETKLGGYDEKFKPYDDFVAKKKAEIGAEQQIQGSKKSIEEMSARELGDSIRQGI